MVSKTVAIDIVRYLQKEKGLSVDDAAQAMGTTPDHIKKVLKNKATFDSDNINACLNFLDLPFWKFADEAIPPSHMPEKARNRVSLCKQLAKHLKKK